MNEVYGLVIKRKDKEPYGFPMDLKYIDELTTHYKEEELLKMVDKSNIIPNFNESNPSIVLGHKIRNKWAEDRQLPIITEPFILSFDIKEVLKENKNYYNILFNQLKNNLKRDNVRDEMKKTILSLKQNPSEFLTLYNNLNYSEQRKFRVILASLVDIKKNEETFKRVRKEELKSA